MRRALQLTVGLFFLAHVARAQPVADAQARLSRACDGVDGAEVTESNSSFTRINIRDHGRIAGSLVLAPTCPAVNPSRVTTTSFFVYAATALPDPRLMARLLDIAHRVARVDDGSLGYQRENEPEVPDFPWPIAMAAGIAALAALVLALRRRGSTVFELRLQHAVPACIQLSIYVYWSLYWPGVAPRVPSILVQIALAYALEALVSFGTLRVWKVGFGPLPIVLSANLFAWFTEPGTLVVIGAAIASRAFLRREQRPIFNPSAFGLAVAGLLSLVSRYFSFQGAFADLNMAPNMAEVLLLLALVPQIRFRIIPVTLFTAVGLWLGSHVFHDTPMYVIPGALIAVTLFVTDPSSTPRTTGGKILFGLFVGVGMGACSTLLDATGHEDDLGKVFPVPIANALVPYFDELGTRFAARVPAVLEQRWNRAHVAVWLLAAVPALWSTKPRIFEAARHWTVGTPGIVYGPGDVPRCEDNPMFCRPFSFVREIELWASHPAKPAPIQLSGS